MINIAEIKNGLVIDHIQAGKGWKVFKWLGLDDVTFSTALIVNAASKKTGKKDIIKIDNILNIDYSVLGYIDPNITVNVIKDDKIVEKHALTLPKEIKNVIRCKNPRCITSIEQGLDQIFVLSDPVNEVYRCKYCETAYTGNDGQK